MESQQIKPQNPKEEEIITNRKLGLFAALLPIGALIIFLSYNVYVYEDNATYGPNQFALLVAAAIAAVIGFSYKVTYEAMMEEIAHNIKSTGGAILILLLVGSLSGTWLLSGVIPSMIYYGLQILNPTIFLVASVIICCIISIATGSSWTTSATVGIALIGIGDALGINMGMTAGAVISGAYFGDKMSPLSDTTNLAPAMAGTDLFTHIRYMTLTTVPSLILTLIIFLILGFFQETHLVSNNSELRDLIQSKFNISPWLFLVPLTVVILIVKKVQPLVALFIGTILGGVFALIFQPQLVSQIAGNDIWSFKTAYKGVMNSIIDEVTIEVPVEKYQKLFTSKGMYGMMNTVWLILCAMTFGGVMEAIGALSKITEGLLKMFNSAFGLFASTVASCLALNVTASDQYLAIVVPGKMFANAYRQKGLAPENLSRSLEDSGTVTSVLVPWNTCGAYQSGVLGVPTLSYLPYAFFNIISPFMTLLFAAFSIKIKMLKDQTKQA